MTEQYTPGLVMKIMTIVKTAMDSTSKFHAASPKAVAIEILDSVLADSSFDFPEGSAAPRDDLSPIEDLLLKCAPGRWTTLPPANEEYLTIADGYNREIITLKKIHAETICSLINTFPAMASELRSLREEVEDLQVVQSPLEKNSFQQHVSELLKSLAAIKLFGKPITAFDSRLSDAITRVASELDKAPRR